MKSGHQLSNYPDANLRSLDDGNAWYRGADLKRPSSEGIRLFRIVSRMVAMPSVMAAHWPVFAVCKTQFTKLSVCSVRWSDHSLQKLFFHMMISCFGIANFIFFYWGEGEESRISDRNV